MMTESARVVRFQTLFRLGGDIKRFAIITFQ